MVCVCGVCVCVHVFVCACVCLCVCVFVGVFVCVICVFVDVHNHGPWRVWSPLSLTGKIVARVTTPVFTVTLTVGLKKVVSP
jgi:hypothetical protein